MALLYSPDGSARRDIQIRDNAGGGKPTFQVNSWCGKSEERLFASTTRAEFSPKVQEVDDNKVVAGKSTDYSNSGQLSFSHKGGQAGRIATIRGSNIFNPQEGQDKPTKQLCAPKLREFYGTELKRTQTDIPAGSPRVTAKERPAGGFHTRTVTETKRREIMGSDIFGTRALQG